MQPTITRRLVIFFGALLLLVYTLAPMYWLFNMALMYKSEALSTPAHLAPEQPTLANFVRIFSIQAYGPKGEKLDGIGQAPLMRAGWWNSLQISIGVTLITMLVGLPVAYALGRLEFKHKTGLLFTLITTRAYPPVAVLIPFSYIFMMLKLQGSVLGLIIIYLTITIPLISWVMAGFFASLPRNMEHLARTDGLTRMQAFYRVMLPMAAPGVAASAVIAFLLAWNEFTFAVILAAGSPAQTFPPALSGVFVMVSEPNAMAAGAAMGIIPPAILALLFQSRIRKLNIVNPL